MGDSAITLDLGNVIEEQLNNKALAIKAWLERQALTGIRDIIVAYSSVAVLYDPELVRGSLPAGDERGIYNYMYQKLEDAWRFSEADRVISSLGDIIRIPVCYGQEYGPDLSVLAQEKEMSEAEIIGLHSAVVYKVYMIGFLPGFAYLGKMDSRLTSSRKQRPVPVTPGGVGIAGNQTGIYPLQSPGGWQIIGRTPWRLFDPAVSPPVRLAIGDRVSFVPITREEFIAFTAVVPASKPFKIIND